MVEVDSCPPKKTQLKELSTPKLKIGHYLLTQVGLNLLYMTLFLLQNTKGEILKNVHTACFNTKSMENRSVFAPEINQTVKGIAHPKILILSLFTNPHDSVINNPHKPVWLSCVTFILLLWITETFFKITTFIKTENQTFWNNSRVSKWWLTFCLDCSFKGL